jgi:hypothetical protein
MFFAEVGAVLGGVPPYVRACLLAVVGAARLRVGGLTSTFANRVWVAVLWLY